MGVSTQIRHIRGLTVGLSMTLLLVSAVAPVMAAEAGDDHDVVGRYSVESAAGGAVWAFQPSGQLIVLGPADLMAEGTWTGVAGSSSKFDASLDIAVTSQQLTVLGEVSPDRGAIALYIAATPPDDEQQALPWPAESRLTGTLMGMVSEPTPAPSPAAMECLRPVWATDGQVEWDPCASIGAAQGSAAASPQP